MIRSQGDWLADELMRVLKEIEELIPLWPDGTADSYDGTANPVILKLVRDARKLRAN